MTTDDVFNVCIDAPTVALVDAWARRSAFQPSRRQAVRALLRRALREMHPKAAPTASEPAATPVSVGSDQ
jgi:hypothetical protein